MHISSLYPPGTISIIYGEKKMENPISMQQSEGGKWIQISINLSSILKCVHFCKSIFELVPTLQLSKVKLWPAGALDRVIAWQ